MKNKPSNGLQNITASQKIVNVLKTVYDYVNIFDIPKLTREISCDVKHIRENYDKSVVAIGKYKEDLIKEQDLRMKEKALFLSVLDHLDDMVWAKDISGKYIVANRSFREKFCYGITWDELQGRTDKELAAEFKELVGEENHTFGEMCANSDVVIHETQLPQEFLEFGNIDGKLMKLVVNKSPLFNHEGKMIATCGSGRDVTKWHGDIERAIREIKEECPCFQHEDAERILKELNKFRFEEGDHAK